MYLAKYLPPEQILLGIEAKDKWELIDRMLDALMGSPACKNQSDEVRERIRPAVIAREKEMPTGIGNGYAYPHGRVQGFKGFAVCLAILKNEMDYEARDGRPVRVACMVLTPEESPTVGLRIVGSLVSMLSDETVRNYFLSETDPAGIYDRLSAKPLALDVPLTAREIMRPPFVEIYPDTPLREMTHKMLEYRVEAVPVNDRDGRIVGEVTCDLLFKMGLPDFLSQLSSVAFIRNFDPFEKYFEQEAGATAGDVMSKDFATVAEDATLMEIVYLLSVRNHYKVYVVRDGKKAGIIDRITVLDHILNL